MRVIELTEGIAGSYCTKVLADAGADVIKVESDAGDGLRRSGSGALFAHLNAGKRSVRSAEGLWGAADVVVAHPPLDVAGLRARFPALVVATISMCGSDGPWAQRPATEFTLQAACGSIGQRGLPEHPPLAAGGRVGEWTTGTYAAAAVLAALREARRTGTGEHIDISMLDCMAVTMTTYPSVFASFLGWPPASGTGRTIEVPSIEPTADGYAVFTTNSAQQLRDFLIMIGRADLLDDAELARAAGRFARREEFSRAVHAYTTKHTTAEVLEDAALLRIPSGPVLDGASVTGFEQFRVRGVFEPDATGRFVRPRPPYRIDGAWPGASGPAPAHGADDGRVEWEPRATRVAEPWRLPLSGLRVLDCTAWWAGPVAPHSLACLGADVIKVESTVRPDMMRYSATRPPSEDGWWEWGPIFHAVNAGKRGITLDLTRPEGIDAFEALVATADMLVENYTPRVMDQFGLGWERIHALNPRLLMVRMPAFGLDGPWRDRTGFAQTMESVTGMAWVTGFEDGPPVLVRGACDPIAGMHAVIAALVALIQRDRDGEGRLVEAVMVEAALNAAAEQVVEHSAAGRLFSRSGNRSPDVAPQGVYPCAGEDRWVAIAAATDDQWAALVDVLARPPELEGHDLATAAGRRARHDEIDALIARWTSARGPDAAAEALVGAGVPAAAVIPHREVCHNPQLRHRRLFEEEDHPVTGRHELPAFPARFSQVDRWYRRPSPTLGQHTAEVLQEIGWGDRVAELESAGITGNRPKGA